MILLTCYIKLSQVLKSRSTMLPWWRLILQKPSTASTILLLNSKIISSGVRPSIVLTISSFLSDRTQSVKHKGQLSGLKNITCGVPQGTKLGPAIFSVMVMTLRKLIDGNLSTTSPWLKYVMPKQILISFNIIWMLWMIGVRLMICCLNHQSVTSCMLIF